jgi:TRAP-type mannitol/chloroaromatic compound transport system permease small subunit
MVEHEVTGWMDRISLTIGRIAMFLVPFIVVIMFYEVVRRYIFEKPTLWVNEMSLWVGGMIYLLAGLYVMQQRGHIRMFILYDIVPRPVQKAFDTISTLLICLFAAAVIYGGYNEALTKLLRWETFGTAWDPPIPATIKPLILVSVVLIALQSVSNLIHDWHKGKIVHEIADEVVIDMMISDTDKTSDNDEKK